ncbi:response regulator [Acidisoma cellulosilyticum]|nr:response regulator [Acidisoma cellulosilyticum]
MTKIKTVILVVEDEPLLRMAAVDMVEDAGFEAIEAADATEAVRILETRPDIRIVFTDIDMPRGMDGMKLAACIRDRWPPITVILTSGYHDVSEVTLPARSLFFPKPYKEQDVVAAFRRLAA